MTNFQTMRLGLMQMLQTFQGGQIQHALFTTFNFDPGFFERNILPLICGLQQDEVQSKSIEALSRELYHPLKSLKVTVAYDQSVLQGFQGRFRYSLLPKHLPGGYFHSKLVVLTGLDSEQQPIATVIVSSGNLTLSGWGSNIEVAAWTPVNNKNAKELIGFYQYLNDSDDKDMEDATETLKKIQITTKGPELFLHYPTGRDTLFDRIFKTRLEKEMHIFSPYWGDKVIFKFQSSGTVFCYPAKEQYGHTFCLPKENLVEEIKVRAIRGEESFRHAKAYYWNKFLAIGSANCTGQALLSSKNVEAMLLYSDQSKPALINKAEDLTDWHQQSGAEEGPETVPFGIMVVADYAKRLYQISIEISDAKRCNSWQLFLFDKLESEGSSSVEQESKFNNTKDVAKVYRIDWDGSEGPHSIMGMVIPKNGSDIELGYRPKRYLDQILQDMLRHKITGSGGGVGRGLKPDEDSESYVETDTEDLNDETKGYDFDMYGMYQSFFELRKDLVTARSADKNWMQLELRDTLHEIFLCLQNGEIKHPVQQWLMLQEVIDISRSLPAFDKSKEYSAFLSELTKSILKLLKRDSNLMGKYKISPKNLISWTCKELGYGN